MRHTVLCVGELLWDALPDGLFLGGAPFNVACHLHALGVEVAVASRIGDDRLGHEARRRVEARGLSPSLVQVDSALPTGFVQVDLEPGTDAPDYDILEPAAWDALALTDALQQQAEAADALVFGSLAQRAAPSRTTIQHLCEADLLRVFDVNLRPPYADRAVVERSLRAADIVKLNEQELRRLRDWFGLPAGPAAGMAALADSFGTPTVCVTKGSEGAWLWHEGERHHHAGYATRVADPVGAGDAFLAALLAGLLAGDDGPAILSRANRLGAYVAAHSGAFPAYTVDALDAVAHLSLPSPSADAS